MSGFQITLPDVAAGRTISGSADIDLGEVEALQKALTAGYGTDVSTLTGGSALRIQSLDTTMKAVIQENEHFRLFNALSKQSATATVDEWTEQNSVGGFLGGTTNSETGTIAAAQGSYARRVALVKYLMTRAEVSLVSTLGNNLAKSEAVEGHAAAMRLLTDAEFLSFEGDSTVVPTEFDGITAQLVAGVAAGAIGSEHVIDNAGGSLSSVNALNDAAARIAGFGNFGTPSDLFMSQLCQSDFDTGLDPAYRVSLSSTGQDIMIGSPVVGIRTSWGNIKTNPDVFIRDESQLTPFESRYAAIAAANSAIEPSISVQPADAGADAASNWLAGHAGNYYYAITGVSSAGESQAVVSSVVAVSAGDKVTMTITASGGGTETGYAIYRSRKNGTNALTDLRLVKRIPKAGGTTVFTDYNADMPGTTKAFVLNMKAGADAINFRQLLPMMKFQLYPTQAATLPWAQLLFGYLRLAKRQHHVVIKNIVPGGAKWKPFV